MSKEFDVIVPEERQTLLGMKFASKFAVKVVKRFKFSFSVGLTSLQKRLRDKGVLIGCRRKWAVPMRCGG